MKPNDDELLSIDRYFRRDDSFDVTRPILKLSIKKPLFSFSGVICYDGGCTFDVNDKNALCIYPDSLHCFSYPHPKNEPPKSYEKHKTKPGAIGVFKQYGKGLIIYWGSRWSFSDEMFDYYDNSLCFNKIISTLLGIHGFNIELARRMKNPQRHRLLHGFPMTKGMETIEDPPSDILFNIPRDTNKDLCIGVIPHPLCNPLVDKCGYCTFPFERYKPEKETSSIHTVCAEIKALRNKIDILRKKKVTSIYFGGGTANLTEADNFQLLCETIRDEFNIKHGAEITLEGAPHYFEKSDLLYIIKDIFLNATHRISLGIQTFDERMLKLMGRSIMNETGSVEKAIQNARDAGFNISGDFLFNLPDQSFDKIKQDLNHIIDLGVEHICWYNLVAYPGLRTPWGEDIEILRRLPSENKRLDNWLKLYYALLDSGYEAVTVTDFRLKKAGEKGRYRYEEDLRHPEKNNWLGLGSYATSVITNDRFTRGLKLMNPDSLIEYIRRQWEYSIPWNRFFLYRKEDLKIYWLTRQIKGLSISKKMYNKLFNSELEDDYSPAFSQLCNQGLLEDHIDRFTLTPVGFYYADSIAGILAWLRVGELIARKSSYVISKFIHGRRIIETHRGDVIEDWNESKDTFMG